MAEQEAPQEQPDRLEDPSPKPAEERQRAAVGAGTVSPVGRLPFPHNLPNQVTGFVGRDRELAEVRQLLTQARLVTLTGSGGCGKTRLALQVAAQVLEEFWDGVWLVELAALNNPTLVPQAVVSALDVREEPGRPVPARLADFLRSKRLLLVLDNCEHLVAACAALVDDVLRLLAAGRTSNEIATALVVSVPTVARHIANIYDKIGVRGRAAAATYALKHGLVEGHAP